MRALTLRVVTTGFLFGVLDPVYSTENMATAIPHAKPGECYARVVVPAKYRTESSTVVIKEATESVNIIPAKFDWVDQNSLVSEATTELKVIPATYSTVAQSIEVSAAETLWVSGSVYSTVEANPGLLSLAQAGGADIKSATVGHCFREYYEPPQYDTVTERVLVSEASETIKIAPAKYQWVEQKQMVAAASTLIEVPAVYETVEERIKVEDAQVVWKKGRGSVEKIDNTSGEIMCLVEIPAVYKTVEKTVLKSPASVQIKEQPVRFVTSRVRKLIEPAREVRKPVPARYREISKRVKTTNGTHFWRDIEDDSVSPSARNTHNVICRKEIPAKEITISRMVVDQPAAVQKIEIPARHNTKKVRRLLSEAKQSRVVVPATTRQVSKRIRVSGTRLEWQPILCETNTTEKTIRKVQSALAETGFYTGAIDGETTKATMNAVENFQLHNGLATGGLTIQLLNELGVNPG